MHNGTHIHPRFSIITVTYNAGKVIEDTIQSIINQTYKNVEYIIIDGGSKDNTLNIIDKYKNLISKVISEPDNGLYDAMNKGFKLATGDYVCFLNAGDCLHEDETLALMVKSVNKNYLPDVLYGETAIVNSERHFLHMRRLKAPEKLNWKSFKNGMLVCHQSMIVKKSVVSKFDLKYKYSSDVDWSIKCLKKSENIFNSEMIISRFLDGGVSKKRMKASLKERFIIMSEYYGLIPTLIRHF